MNPNRSRKNLQLLITVIFLLGLSFWVGLNIGYVKSNEVRQFAFLANDNVLPPQGVDFTPLWRAWNALEKNFVAAATSTEPITNEERLWGAISGLADAYGDPYTVFLSPAEATTFQEEVNGSFGGVGIEIGIREEALTVIAPLKDSPADRAGMKAQDKIVEIDGASTEGITIDEAVQTIRGEIGTTVELVVSRKDEERLFTFNVTRDTIKIPTIDTELRNDGVFVISLYNFSAQSPSLFEEALNEFVSSQSNKLVLDLRNNPGGFLEAAVDIASWFLPAGKIVVSEDFGDGTTKKDRRTRDKQLNGDFAMAVLVNEGSASASEILAGALKEHGVAVLVGKSTFGKGSVQELISITDETSLKVTIARWLTPLGNSISDGGLDPDIEVDITEEDFEEERDPQLERAVKFLLEGE